MINLGEITIANFLSYGNYETTVKIGGLGLCLVTGDNGAGKSNLANAILWCLFGRTIQDAKPGDEIINWQHGKDCMVRLRLKDGTSITRTRKKAGHNELVVDVNGEVTLSTVSTTPNQQTQLNKMFGLDWHVFTGSSFFTQEGQPWLEMADQTRKTAIERFLKIDRLSLYAESAKETSGTLIANQQKLSAKQEEIQAILKNIEAELEHARGKEETFEQQRGQRRQQALAQAADYGRQAGEIENPDIEYIRKVWKVIEELNQKISKLQAREWQAALDEKSSNQRVADLAVRIRNWRDKAGRICLECEQEVDGEHSEAKAGELERERAEHDLAARSARDRRQQLAGKIAMARESIREATPRMTVNEAMVVQERQRMLREYEGKELLRAERIDREQNPYGEMIGRLEASRAEAVARGERIEADLSRYDFLVKHYNYVYRAYSDRRKIKSYLIGRHIPYFNRRMAHYTDYFDLDVAISLDESLAVVSNLWKYKWMSGGERKRADVAFMLSMFDLHEKLYGRQCNVIMLDEVDGRLDAPGIDALVGIIRGELATRVDAVLVISHKEQMRDYFSHHMTVKRTERLSSLTLSA